ncbi:MULTISPECIES: Clo7bot family Cys-rich peptide [Clostridium]|uniref:Clo7bot family Cys-rich peptide n=1 Tax=Clostridium senegalense TaxID=1465809 RepID=A0A6M0GXQ7_9CLOT|nr:MULTISPECIES: Clo7bot family Cys-rich peptide [Clostridium]MBU5225617.1 Clo7bot family Cys-rich peptide [Clostridium senegalense]NEU03265.1 Clo7bot family Cys-rich peptide [Clostridium senegalense]
MKYVIYRKKELRYSLGYCYCSNCSDCHENCGNQCKTYYY